MKKITGLKKAVGDYNRANKGGAFSPNYAELMFDESTGELWTDFFCSLGHNEWKEYHDQSIVYLGRLMAGEYYENPDEFKITMATVKDYISRNYGDKFSV